MVQYRVILNDIVSGIIGMFYRKYEAPGKERRYIIEYKPPTMFGMMSKPLKLPSTIPAEGIIEIPGTRCADGYPRLIVFSYGNDSSHPPLVPNLAAQQISETIQKLDQLSISTESRHESVAARERILDRTREKVVKDAVKLGRETSQPKKRRSGFISIGDEDDL